MQIHQILAELEEVEKHAVSFCCSTKRRDQTQFQEFFEFLEKNECHVSDKLSIEQIEKSEYGVKVKKNFKKGDILFEIPNKVILTLNDANKLEIERLLKEDKMLAGMQNISLALLVLFLKASLNTDESSSENNELISKWKAYLNVLPSEFHTPLYFNLDEIKILQPTVCFSNNNDYNFWKLLNNLCFLIA